MYFVFAYRLGQMTRLRRRTWQEAFETARELRNEGWRVAVHKQPPIVVEMRQEEPS